MNFDVEAIRKAISESSASSKIYIGCDSKRSREGKVKFATVVIIHIDGRHGGKMFTDIETEQYYDNVKKPQMRLLAEAMKAVEIAHALIDVIGDRDFEVHLDLNSNPKYKSNDVVKQATGYVLGMLGFEAKLKPEAFAASTAADRVAE